jgi:hypothetical protein
MRPAEALDVHTALSEIMNTELGAGYLVSFTETSHKMVKKITQNERAYFVSTFRNHLKHADTYHLDVRMADAVMGHADQLSEVMQIGAFEPPSACGVLVLDQPWEITEVRGRIERANLVTWGPIRLGDEHGKLYGTGILLTVWQDNRTSDAVIEEIKQDPGQAELLRRLGGFSLIAIDTVYRDIRLGPRYYPVPEDTRAALEAEGSEVADLLGSLVHPIMATWDLMGQSRANLQDEPVQRASVRRAKRAGLPARVTVVTLRRPEHTDHTGTGTPLAYRVPVKPHTRHYWVRDPATGELVREKRNIELHWRGPENAPVHVSEKVYTLKK